MAPAPRSRRQRGISLIEAVVALGVMATGLLGVVGVQATLRSNADIARQRADAVRLAQQKIEDLRFFRDVTGTAPTYTGMVGGVETLTPPQSNATFTRTTEVSLQDARPGVPDLQAEPRAKNVVVTVGWTDRAGQAQSVTLRTSVAGIAPALAGSLAVPPEGNSIVRQPLNRDRGIPPAAVNLGDGRSALRPGGSASTVVWVFNNVSGVVTRCTLATDAVLSAATVNTAVCASPRFRLVSGFIRFSLSGVLSEAEVLQPSSDRPPALDALLMQVLQTAPATPALPECFMRADAGAPKVTEYLCAVPIDNQTAQDAWSGSLRLTPTALFDPTQAQPFQATYRLCRYIVDRQDLVVTPTSVNVATSFSNIRGSLVNRNFLVIPAQSSCPFPFPSPFPVPQQGPIVLPSPFPLWLVQHQPAP